MKLIAVVGKTGSGKSYFSDLLVKYLAESFDKTAIHISIDKIGHRATQDSEILNSLRPLFGQNIFDGNGNISRKKLSDLVFNDKEALETLNKVTLPKMIEIINEMISSNHDKDFVILDYALLPKISEIFKACHYKILVEASSEVRKERILARDKVSEQKFLQREQASLKYNHEDYDLIIDNTFIYNIDVEQLPKINIDAYATCFHLIELEKQENVAYYPGSFDPITYGHIDIINKCLKLGFDKVIVAVTHNLTKKGSMFTLEERVDMIKEVFKLIPKVEIITVDSGKASARIAKELNCSALIRGLRNVTDFEYELNLSKVNTTISDVETVFLTASHKYDFVSSSSVRELAYLGEDITLYVPPEIEKCVKEKSKSYI